MLMHSRIKLRVCMDYMHLHTYIEMRVQRVHVFEYITYTIRTYINLYRVHLHTYVCMHSYTNTYLTSILVTICHRRCIDIDFRLAG